MKQPKARCLRLFLLSVNNLLYSILIICCALLFGCASEHGITGSVGGKTVWQHPDPAPPWILAAPPSDNTNFYFLGISGQANDERTAKGMAVNDALTQVARYLGVNVKVVNHYYATGHAMASDSMDVRNSVNLHTVMLSDEIISKGKYEWYFRRINKGWDEYFEARVLLAVSSDDINLITDLSDDSKKRVAAIQRKRNETKYTLEEGGLDEAVKNKNGYIVGTGKASGSNNKAAAEAAAKAAARHDAFAQLNQRINGLRVVGAASSQNGSHNETTTIIQDGRVKGRIVSESVEWIDGTPVATVVMLPL